MAFQSLLEFFFRYRPNLQERVEFDYVLTLIVLSSDAESRRDPSQLKATLFTGAECPFSICD